MRTVLILAMLAPLPVAAQQFQPPTGCVGFLTVQSRTCKVSNHWTCPGETPGDKWRVDIGPNGPNFVSRVDNEAQWIESYNLFPTRKSRLVSSADAASMTELLTNGVDTFDFIITRDTGTENVVGFDRVNGPEIQIDGEGLLPTTYSAKSVGDDGEVVWQREGQEYISATHRIFFSGAGVTVRDGEDVPYNFSPVEFIYPGEEGFFPSRPKYDCESLSAELDQEAPEHVRGTVARLKTLAQFHTISAKADPTDRRVP